MVLKGRIEHSAFGTEWKTGTVLDTPKRRNLIEELVTQVLEAFKKPKITRSSYSKINNCRKPL